ncbi:ATP-binding cassette domain-containing protein [Luteimonas fraxinea]|uniref:ABC transporter ATP-binding protein n=1 Tax=Luteimonas fraxinea TaxID=2901869 RepID=UPI001E4E7972|nr:ATP-binding cassette domain-containing protein [Luteimonas fraxinea]UHH09652.1 ATP-binding cassette domain-containing protein [Luteimonas fraxinea]
MLELESIQKSFGDVSAVSDVSFKVPPGAVSALIGPNGAGKSTTFRIICGLARQDSGALKWLDRPLHSSLPKEKISFLPEERGLYQDVEVQDLLRYWAKLRAVKSSSVDTLVSQWLTRFDLNHKRTEKVRSLSKGNQQKLQLAVCLIHSPHLLILDEPFSGLDPLNQDLVSDVILEQAARGASVLISAHQLSIVEKIATNVIMINAGRASEIVNFRRREDDGRNAVQRRVLVYVAPGANPQFDEIPAHSAERVSDDCLLLTFGASSLRDFTSALSRIASDESVIDIETSRPGLHEAYVESINSSKAGI